MSELIDETGKVYGPWVVIRRHWENYKMNRTASWLCECQKCGYRRVINGNNLRFGQYGRTCPICKNRGENN